MSKGINLLYWSVFRKWRDLAIQFENSPPWVEECVNSSKTNSLIFNEVYEPPIHHISQGGNLTIQMENATPQVEMIVMMWRKKSGNSVWKCYSPSISRSEEFNHIWKCCSPARRRSENVKGKSLLFNEVYLPPILHISQGGYLTIQFSIWKLSSLSRRGC